MPVPRDPVADLRRIAFLLERAGEATYRVRAFRGAAATIATMSAEELATRAAEGTLVKVKGLGEVTARCVAESLRGEEPVYLRRLEATEGTDIGEAAAAIRTALRGDCHCHSDWSDGGSPIEDMVTTAIALGHRYLVLTDHSPRLTVARGLSAERLREQIDVVAAINAALGETGTDFRLLTGIEVDILADGSLDQTDELLAQLDVVVGSVHSGLRDDADTMTRRMLRAVANPHLDILGHCTGRKLVTDTPGSDRAHARGGRAAKGRPESTFDAAAVFAACRDHGKAVEINSRPDRLDPPKRLLRQAYEMGCLFAIDSDAHAPGQLDWLGNGCERAALCGIEAERVVNTWPVEELLAWTAGHATGKQAASRNQG
ncbi:MAG: PHP domain-containing protein [Micromonosporaceae bacterium]|nr:PHP domain-containing protein [Micromonosporaceae bacterium]